MSKYAALAEAMEEILNHGWGGDNFFPNVMEPKVCTHCQCLTIHVVDARVNLAQTLFLKAKCIECGEFSPTRSLAASDSPFIMPFGKYKGRSLNEILCDDAGYIRWLAENCSNQRIREKAEAIL